MNLSPKIDQRSADLTNKSGVVLGEDWVLPDGITETEMRATRRAAGFGPVNRSPLARKMVTFNLLAMAVLIFGVLYLNPFRNSLMMQREEGLLTEANLIAAVATVQLADAPVDPGALDWSALRNIVAKIELPPEVDVFVFEHDRMVLATTQTTSRADFRTLGGMIPAPHQTSVTRVLSEAWRGVSGLLVSAAPVDMRVVAQNVAERAHVVALQGESLFLSAQTPDGGEVFSVAVPIRHAGAVVGAVVLTSTSEEIDNLVWYEREQLLQMFVVALIVSVGLSLLLASTIASPLADLAAAAEVGRDRNARKMAPGRIRIPDLTARPDEIGRLSGAIRGMVAALYDRIDQNEQFAADVAHEIKNPLASLRSAVVTLRLPHPEDKRQQLLNVIEHDVRRLDRLVSDISNASRLDSELVKEDAEHFDLVKMIRNLCDHLGNGAKENGIDFIADLPTEPIMVEGLEERLAQVFVNLIGNAVSFCEEGDAVRVWTRQREDRVLIVVEDTGPGIPDLALSKVFKRFYSERPVGQFGNHSGLGLAISKQIVEAHGGVIWAENIRPTDADVTSEPLGARFVVGLPV